MTGIECTWLGGMKPASNKENKDMPKIEKTAGKHSSPKLTNKGERDLWMMSTTHKD